MSTYPKRKTNSVKSPEFQEDFEGVKLVRKEPSTIPNLMHLTARFGQEGETITLKQ